MNKKACITCLSVACIVLLGMGVASAQNRDVDFDLAIRTVDAYIEDQGARPTFGTMGGRDLDGNGIWEEHSMGMLSGILQNNSPGINAGRISAIQSGFTGNMARVAVDLVIHISVAGVINETFDVLAELRNEDPRFADSLQMMLAGYMTVADSVTVNALNTFIWSLAEWYVCNKTTYCSYLGMINLQDLLRFSAGNYQCFGDADGPGTNWLGYAGDIEADGINNVTEYNTAAGQRENWLVASNMNPPLHIVGNPVGASKWTGDTHNFTAAARGGNGTRIFHWFRVDGTKFVPNAGQGEITQGSTAGGATVQTQHTYQNTYLSMDDANKNFICVVEDSWSPYNFGSGVGGRTSGPAKMIIQMRPWAVTSQPSDQYKQPGQTASMTFGVTGGMNIPSFQWYRNGSPVGGATGQTLSFANLQPSDEGNYYCTATNNNGSGNQTFTSSTVFLGVRPPVNFVTQPAGAHKKVGDTHTFSVSTQDGHPPITYTWRRGTVSVSSSNPYTISSLLAINHGSYTCTVSDRSGTEITSNAADLTVLSFSRQPSPADAKVGEPVSFAVVAAGGSGAGTYTYQWQFRPLAGVFAPILGAVDSSYSIGAAQLSNQGHYRCDVTDGFGVVLASDNAELSISAYPIRFLIQPTAGKKYTGESHTFKVQAAGGHLTPAIPNFTYQWRKDGSDIPTATKTEFTVTNVDANRAGLYQCAVRDADRQYPASPALSGSALLEVTDPLTITLPPQDADVYVGETHRFTVNVTGGFVSPTFKWYRDNPPNSNHVLLTPNPLQQVNNYYEVVSAVEESAGRYRVDVADGVAERSTLRIDSALAYLTVSEPLVLAQDTQANGATEANLVRGQKLILTVLAEGGIRARHYQWKLDDGINPPLNVGSDSPTFVVEYSSEGDSGQYTCQIWDTPNSSREPTTLVSTPVTVSVRPPLGFTPVGQPKGTTLYVGELAKFEVQVEGLFGQAVYEWYHRAADNSVTVVGSNAAVFQLAAVTLDDNGQYWCEVSDTAYPESKIVSDVAVLEVSDHLSVAASPIGGLATAGGSFTLSVEAAGGIGVKHYVWQKMDIGGYFQVLPTAPDDKNFKLESLGVADSGVYRVTVTDSAYPTPDTVDSGQATLTVQEGTPVAGLTGMALMAAACALGGAMTLRRRK